MKTALLDGDIFCYRIGWACEKESQQVCLNTLNKALTDIVMKLPVTDWEVHLTGKTNFRNDHAVTAPYKGNRKGGRPTHYDAIRNYMLTKWDANLSDNEEADDTLSIRAAQLGDDAVIVSIDKDFDQCQGWHYNFVKDHTYYIEHDEGLLNFYMQFLTGDRIDNIIGVKGIGPKKAHEWLSGLSEHQMYDVVAYLLGSEDRAIENGRLLYLRRKENELWNSPYISTPKS